MKTRRKDYTRKLDEAGDAILRKHDVVFRSIPPGHRAVILADGQRNTAKRKRSNKLRKLFMDNVQVKMLDDEKPAPYVPISPPLSMDVPALATDDFHPVVIKDEDDGSFVEAILEL